MAFRFTLSGTKEAVIAKLPDEKDNDKDSDGTQLAAVRAYIASEIKAMPNTFNGVLVTAVGHSDGRSRQSQIVITQHTIHV